MPETTVRLAVPGDLDPLVRLTTEAMHFPMGHRVREWFTDHPTMTLDRIAVAVDGDAIVATAALVPEPFLVRGVPVPTGVWDAVATDAHYRRRGLCRRLMAFLEETHRPALLLVEGATDVYRRLGYEPAFPNRGGCNSGGAIVRAADVPEIGTSGVRAATPEDAEWLAAFRREIAEGSALGTAPEVAAWTHALRTDRTVVGPGGTTLNRWQEIRILYDESDEPVGYFAHDPWDIGLLMEMEIDPGQNWREAGSAALRALAAFSGATELKVALPDDHSLLAAFPVLLGRRERGGSDWHARIPDPIRFLTTIRLALETILARSPLAGWSGAVTFSREADGFRIVGRRGSLTFEGAGNGEPDVRLTETAFVRLVLTGTPLAELMAEDRSVGGNDEGLALLGALFPPGRVSARGI